MKKKLIASDFDGTLRRSENITKSDADAVKEWQSQNNYFGIVTGRGKDFLEYIKELPVNPDFLIIYNGAYIIDKNNNVVFESYIDYDTFYDLEKLVSKTENVINFDKAEPGVSKHQYYATYDCTESALAAAILINQNMSDKVSAFVNGIHLNVAPKGSSKADGVRIIQNYYNLQKEEVAVVGDDYNDLDMIKAFDGWAMLTGKSDVKKQAKHICDSIASLCRELG